MRKIKLILGLCLLSLLLKSQSDLLSGGYQTPGGVMDTVFDRDGKRYFINDLSVIPLPDSSPAALAAATQSCDAGYFRLFFEPGSLVTTAQQNVLCQLFTDMSCFIKSPLSSACHTTTNTTTKVNVYVTDNATGTNLGYANPLYIIPYNPLSANPGVAEDLVWKTIISGVDPYIGVVPPLIASSSFYHLIVNVNPSISWNTNLAATSLIGNDFDLYTVFLHELTHGLGFHTSIGRTGVSVYGASNNYYSRYDVFLKNHSGTPLLTNGAPTAPYTNLTYIGNPAANINPGVCLSTGGTSGNANCATNVIYASNSVTVPVYNPYCWESGSSLSHFEDKCYPPYIDNGYFAMCEADNGYIRRHLVEEEKHVLCDLGYSVSATYTSPAALANKTYTSGACSGINVWGVNDGISGSNYAFVVASSTLSIPIVSLLANDSPNATSVTNVSFVYSAPGITFSQTSTALVLSLAPGVVQTCGQILLQYIPKDASGQAGNVTYIYVYVNCINCAPPNVCNMIQNGGFETGSPGCQSNNVFLASCWADLGPTPDLPSDNFCPAIGLTIGNPVYVNSFGLSSTHNSGANHRCAAFRTDFGATGGGSETIRNTLGNPLQPGVTYALGFWAFTSKGVNYPSPPPMVLSFASTASATPVTGPTYVYPTGLNILTSFTLPASDADLHWHYYQSTFTFTGTVNHNVLTIGGDGIKSYAVNGNQSGGTYTYIDDVTLVEQATLPTFTPPNICKGAVLTNLFQYTGNGGGGGGTFSGPGVVNNGGGSWDINTASVNPGINYYTFIQTNTLSGCNYSTTAQLQVIQITPTITASAPNFFCITPSSSNTTALNATAGAGTYTYTWLPSNTTGSSIIVVPFSTSVYTVSVTDGQCVGTKTAVVNVIPPLSFTNLPTYWCTGTKVQYLENFLSSSTPTGGAWSAPGFSISTVSPGQHILSVLANATPGTHTVNYIYTAAAGCTASINFTVNVVTTPAVVTNGNLTQCSNIAGYSTTLTAIPFAGPYTYTWSPGNLPGQTVTVAPTVSTVYTVNAENTGCTSTATLLVNISNQCCASNNYITASSVPSGTYSGLFAINQNITITNSVTFGGEFLVAPNVSITVNGGGALISEGKPGVHMLACESMWSGINVLNNGQVNLQYGDLIEDALVAINLDNSIYANTYSTTAGVFLANTVFNRNKIGVAIRNYNAFGATNSLPVFMQNCIFTCRDLQLIPGITLWPSAIASYLTQNLGTQPNPFSHPYPMLSNPPPANLKAPNTSIGSQYGVMIENTGTTTFGLGSSVNYYGIQIGDNTQNGARNIFDNQVYGIYSINSNARISNCTFLDTRSSGSTPNLTPGAGIYALNDLTNSGNYNNSLDLVNPNAASLYNNRFYDCQQGVKTSNLARLNAGYCLFASNQNTLYHPSTLNNGNMGISMTGGLFKNYNVSNNQFYNINTGIYAGANNVTPPNSNTGQWWGNFNVDNNTFFLLQNWQQHYEFCNNAIVIENVMSSRTSAVQSTGLYTVSPNTGLQITNNIINDVYRGISVNNFNNSVFNKVCTGNKINLRVDEMTAGSLQWGIRYNNVYKGSVRSNTVSSSIFNPSYTYTASGVYMSMNNTATVQCNSTSALYRGFQFAGLNTATKWFNNTMSGHTNGLALTDKGIIGPQGISTAPSDNHWTGQWSGTKRGTYTDANSWAYYPATAVSNPSNSVLWVRSSYYPPNNFGVVYGQFYLPMALPIAISLAPEYDCVNNRFVGPGSTTTTIPPPHRRPLDEAIVNDSLGYSDVTTSLINKTNLFWMIVENDSTQDSSDVLSVFYKTELGKNNGAFKELENSFFDTTPISSSISDLNNITPQNNIEQNMFDFYKFYFTYTANNTLNGDDQRDLYLLANKCPFTDGAVIYQARSLYNFIKGDVIVYNDSLCAPEEYEDDGSEQDTSYVGGGERRSHFSSGEIPADLPLQNVKQVTIYPNPAQNEIFVLSPGETASYELSIYDAQGKELGQIPILTHGHLVQVQLNLINGIYFVSLRDASGSIKRSKLVIAK